MDSLAEMYELLDEDDLAAGLWQKKAKFQETTTAISYEQQGNLFILFLNIFQI